MSLSRRRPGGAPPRSLRTIIETSAFLALLILVVDVAFRRAIPELWPLPYLMFPVLFWAAGRLGTRGLALATLTMTLSAVGYLSRGYGPHVLSYLPPVERVLSVQAFLCIVAVSLLFLGASLAERARAERELRRKTLELSRITKAVDAASEPIMLMDIDRRPIYFNPAFTHQYGYSMDDFKDPSRQIALGVSEQVHAEALSTLRAGGSWADETEVRTRDGRLVPTRISAAPIADEAGQPIGVLVICTLIEDRRNAERRRDAALEIMRVLAGASSIEEAAPRLLQPVCDFLGWAAGLLWSLDSRDDVLRIQAEYHDPARPELKEFIEGSRQFSFKPGVGLAGRVLRHQKAEWIEDVRTEASYLRGAMAKRVGLCTAFAVPIRIGEEATGIIEFYSRERRARDPALLTLVDWLGGQIGLLVQRGRGLKQLETAMEAARAASRAKSDFLANMSHEIRTPMNALLGMLELLSGTRLDAAQRRYMDVAVSSGQTLLSLIEGILDLSKIEAGKVELEEVRLEPRAVAGEVLGALLPKAQKKGLELSLSIEPSVPAALLGDPVRLRQVLTNLIDNAIKFTSRGGVEVKLDASGTGGGHACLHWEVQDTGIGIPREKLLGIFSAFEQADAAITRLYGGTGLGLTICRRLVELMGGRLWVESEVGRGSAFHFTVLMRRAAAPVIEASRSLKGGPRARRELKILLFEDSAFNREVARGLLEREGHHVTEREDAMDAAAAVAADRYDLVLMDLQMPGKSGYEATAEIRAAERRSGGRRVPILALTAQALSGDRERCLEADMDGYVTKPIRLDELWREMEAVVGPLGHRSSAPPAPAPADTVLDRPGLLRRTGGDVAFLEGLAAMFAREHEGMVQRVAEAFAAGDMQAAEHAAHLLKGAAGNVGGVRAAAAAGRLEVLARFGETPPLERLAALRGEVQSLAAELAAFVAEQLSSS